MKRLYKKAKNGKVQQWEIEVSQGRYRTIEGYVDGKLTESKWTECLPKNVGKSNETSSHEQAMKEAESKHKKKMERGYVDDISKVDITQDIINPMLAHKWNSYKKKTFGNIASQPKLDGIRCIGRQDGLYTRTGKKINSAPHIELTVKKLLEGLPKEITLDGELYNHDLKDNFEEIVSIVRKTKPTEEDLAKSAEVMQYHLYDLNHQRQTFAERYASLKLLTELNQFDCIKLTPTDFLQRKEDSDDSLLDHLYEKYLTDGYEGQMIRGSESLYKKGRSTNLLKRKEFIDEEFEIIDIEEGVGNRSGMMGRIVFKTFTASARGNHDYYKELLANKKNYIGKSATVRYQNLTSDNIPRFPVVVNIGREDYEG